MSARVVNAIRNLREAHGSTSKEIMNYIMSQCNVPETTVQRQVFFKEYKFSETLYAVCQHVGCHVYANSHFY